MLKMISFSVCLFFLIGPSRKRVDRKFRRVEKGTLGEGRKEQRE